MNFILTSQSFLKSELVTTWLFKFSASQNLCEREHSKILFGTIILSFSDNPIQLKPGVFRVP